MEVQPPSKVEVRFLPSLDLSDGVPVWIALAIPAWLVATLMGLLISAQ